MKTKDYLELEQRYGAHNYKPLDIVIERAQGVWMYDVEGKKYLDCLSAYSAINQGHCNPKIIQALKDQADKVTLASRAFRNAELGLFYKDICELTGFDRVIVMNSGAEGVETGIKFARKWGYERKLIENNKAEIIVCSNNFHGRTTTIVGFSSEPFYREGFGPYDGGFKTVAYGDVDAFEKAITKNTCGFLIEPIQGEGGIIIPPSGYLKQVEAICKKNNVLLMLDEIQTGLGRTGKLFAYQYEDIVPDMLILGKALSGGVYPVSVVLTSNEVMDVIKPGHHGSTFGGNSLACAVARAAIKVIVDDGLIDRSRMLGELALKKLKQMKSSKVKEVRGRGLLLGIELKEPARAYCEALKDRGLLCKETHSTVIRIAPPLIIEESELLWACEQIEDVLS